MTSYHKIMRLILDFWFASFPFVVFGGSCAMHCGSAADLPLTNIRERFQTSRHVGFDLEERAARPRDHTATPWLSISHRKLSDIMSEILSGAFVKVSHHKYLQDVVFVTLAEMSLRNTTPPQHWLTLMSAVTAQTRGGGQRNIWGHFLSPGQRAAAVTSRWQHTEKSLEACKNIIYDRNYYSNNDITNVMTSSVMSQRGGSIMSSWCLPF